MKPKHGEHEPNTGTNPFVITAQSKGSMVTVTIASPSGATLKGFLVKARAPDDLEESGTNLGQFMLSDDDPYSKTLKCGSTSVSMSFLLPDTFSPHDCHSQFTYSSPLRLSLIGWNHA